MRALIRYTFGGRLFLSCLRHQSSLAPFCRFFGRKEAPLPLSPVLGDTVPHEFPYHLGRRSVLCAADFKELVS